MTEAQLQEFKLKAQKAATVRNSSVKYSATVYGRR